MEGNGINRYAKRARRLRQSGLVREMVAETRLNTKAMIQPYFVVSGSKKVEKISSMPGIERHSPDMLTLVPIDDIRCVRLIRGKTHVTPPSPAAVRAVFESLMDPGDLMRANALEPDEDEARQLAFEQLR